SMAIAPNGDIIAQEDDADEALVVATLDLGDVRRERLANPLLRDERAELIINELRRAWHERTRKPFSDRLPAARHQPGAGAENPRALHPERSPEGRLR